MSDEFANLKKAWDSERATAMAMMEAALSKVATESEARGFARGLESAVNAAKVHAENYRALRDHKATHQAERIVADVLALMTEEK